jgi:6,7-dimethyl-8-ribityllumazine synthase
MYDRSEQNSEQNTDRNTNTRTATPDAEHRNTGQRSEVSGKGAPELTVKNCGDLRVAVIAAQWHEQIMDGLVDGALRALRELGIEEPTLLRVPGSFELPVVAKVLAGRGYDAIVALGVVIRGGTPHFEYVCQGVTAGLTQVSVDTGVPIGFGVLTCDTEQQALDRAGLPGSNEDKGHEAVTAAVATATILRSVSEPWR